MHSSRYTTERRGNRAIAPASQFDAEGGVGISRTVDNLRGSELRANGPEVGEYGVEQRRLQIADSARAARSWLVIDRVSLRLLPSTKRGPRSAPHPFIVRFRTERDLLSPRNTPKPSPPASELRVSANKRLAHLNSEWPRTPASPSPPSLPQTGPAR